MGRGIAVASYDYTDGRYWCTSCDQVLTKNDIFKIRHCPYCHRLLLWNNLPKVRR